MIRRPEILTLAWPRRQRQRRYFVRSSTAAFAVGGTMRCLALDVALSVEWLVVPWLGPMWQASASTTAAATAVIVDITWLANKPTLYVSWQPFNYGRKLLEFSPIEGDTASHHFVDF